MSPIRLESVTAPAAVAAVESKSPYDPRDQCANALQNLRALALRKEVKMKNCDHDWTKFRNKILCVKCCVDLEDVIDKARIVSICAAVNCGNSVTKKGEMCERCVGEIEALRKHYREEAADRAYSSAILKIISAVVVIYASVAGLIWLVK